MKTCSLQSVILNSVSAVPGGESPSDTEEVWKFETTPTVDTTGIHYSQTLSLFLCNRFPVFQHSAFCWSTHISPDVVGLVQLYTRVLSVLSEYVSRKDVFELSRCLVNLLLVALLDVVFGSHILLLIHASVTAGAIYWCWNVLPIYLLSIHTTVSYLNIYFTLSQYLYYWVYFIVIE